MELDALQKQHEAITAAGASLVAISPQTAEKNAEVKRKNRLEFAVLSDVGSAYARELQLAFELPADLREVYTSFGAVLPQFNGEDSWTLPLPTRLVVDRQGVIARMDADPDYTVRPEPTATLEALAALPS